MCPDTDWNSIPFLNWSTAFSSATSVIQSQDCVKAFSSSLDCTQQPLNFSLPNNGQFYDAGNFPNSGSQSLSDASGELQTPLAATTVWALASGLVPSTAIAAQASAGSSGSGSGSGSGSSSGSGSGSSSVPASSSASAASSGSGTTTSSGAAATSMSVVPWRMMVLGGAAVALAI